MIVLISFTIHLNPVTKKNSSRVVRAKNGKTFVIPSEAYTKYEKDCRWFMPKIKTIDFPVNIKATYYMKTKRKVDLTNLHSALADILVKYKVIADDNRDIAATMNGSIVLHDSKNPRTEIEITKIDGYKQWKEEK